MVLAEIIEYGKGVYDVISQAMNYIYSFIQNIFQSFPADSPRKTLWLSIIFLFIVIGIVMIFSSTSWSTQGVKGQSDIQLPSLGMPGADAGGDNQGQGGNSASGSMPEEQDVRNGSLCYTDQDCQLEPGYSTQCCYPESYENYSCAGACQKIEGLSRDDCKHPNSCFYIPYNEQGFRDHAKLGSGRCDVDLDGSIKANPNQFCRDSGGGTAGYDALSVCCTGPNMQSTICYGYCAHDCNDPISCADEDTIGVVIVSGGDV